MIHDQLIDKKTYCPLNNLDGLFEGKKPAPYTVCNSSLSEYAVLDLPMRKINTGLIQYTLVHLFSACIQFNLLYLEFIGTKKTLKDILVIIPPTNEVWGGI